MLVRSQSDIRKKKRVFKEILGKRRRAALINKEIGDILQ